MAASLKIGLVLERFDPDCGGLEHWTWQFARSLAERGHEVHVVAFEFRSDAEQQGIVPHQVAQLKSRIERAETLGATAAALQLDVVHDMGIGWHADIIHPHGGSTAALWEHNLLRIPKWRQIRFWRERRYRQLAEVERRQHTQSSAIIVAVSRMVQRHFETLHGVPAGRIRVIPNGVDVRKFTPECRNQFREATRKELGIGDEIVFLMLAHNLLLKNADALLRAAARLVNAGARVRVIMAGGKRQEKFIKLAETLGISRVVSFLGVVDALHFYSAAEVFVHPTWYDPCSLVTLEAAACGLPVITSRLNGASELMTDGVDGFILDDPADVSALAEKMQELLDPAKREAMGTAGRRMAMSHTFEQQTTKFLRLYDEIAATKLSRSKV